MDRRKFLGNLSSPIVAACAACIFQSCSKGDSGGSTNPSTVPGGTSGVNFMIDLTNNLTSVGSSVVNSGVIVVRLATGNSVSSFTAVQVACTHQGTSINYDTSAGNFLCPNHGSRFSNTGNVINGPATTALKQYNITISGNTLTITG
ncbi:MAG: hypothetical protein C0459_13275 [Chitinophaga sp.]|jgi:cytochrome b6-f complex iron-sulfur subunit|nr:hypothetical protein [Chitinophaga sp.]